MRLERRPLDPSTSTLTRHPRPPTPSLPQSFSRTVDEDFVITNACLDPTTKDGEVGTHPRL